MRLHLLLLLIATILTAACLGGTQSDRTLRNETVSTEPPSSYTFTSQRTLVVNVSDGSQTDRTLSGMIEVTGSVDRQEHIYEINSTYSGEAPSIGSGTKDMAGEMRMIIVNESVYTLRKSSSPDQWHDRAMETDFERYDHLALLHRLLQNASVKHVGSRMIDGTRTRGLAMNITGDEDSLGLGILMAFAGLMQESDAPNPDDISVQTKNVTLWIDPTTHRIRQADTVIRATGTTRGSETETVYTISETTTFGSFGLPVNVTPPQDVTHQPHVREERDTEPIRAGVTFDSNDGVLDVTLVSRQNAENVKVTFSWTTGELTSVMYNVRDRVMLNSSGVWTVGEANVTHHTGGWPQSHTNITTTAVAIRNGTSTQILTEEARLD